MVEITGQLISELDTTVVNGTEEIPVEKGGANHKVTVQQIKEFAQQGAGSPDNSLLVETAEPGFYIIDENMNIGAFVTEDASKGFGSGNSVVVQELNYQI